MISEIHFKCFDSAEVSSSELPDIDRRKLIPHSDD